MKLLGILMAFMMVLPFGYSHAMSDNTDATNTKATAVIFYADSCGACKLIEPRMKEALTQIDQDALNVVTFDFSNRDAIAQTRQVAKDQNVNDVLMEYGARTGFIVLVDKTGNIVDKINVNDNVDAIVEKLTTILS